MGCPFRSLVPITPRVANLGYSAVLNDDVATRFENTEQRYTATCTPPLIGTPVEVTIPAGEYVSYQSQEIADGQALAVAREQAEAALSCELGTYYNTEQSAEYTAYCEGGGIGEPSVGNATVPADEYTSNVSQEAADALAYAAALAEATANAEAGLVCCYQPAYTVGFTYDLAPVDPEDPENYLFLAQNNTYYDCVNETEESDFAGPVFNPVYGAGVVSFFVNPGGVSGPLVGTGNWVLTIDGLTVGSGTLSSPVGGETIVTYVLP